MAKKPRFPRWHDLAAEVNSPARRLVRATAHYGLNSGLHFTPSGEPFAELKRGNMVGRMH